MSRLNSEVSIVQTEGEAQAEPRWQEGEGPLYKENLVYLPFARHLAEEDEVVQAKAA